MRSTSLRATSLRQSVSKDAKPQFSAKASALAPFRAQTAVSTGSYSRSKNLFTLPKAFEWVRPMKPQPTTPIPSFFFARIVTLRKPGLLTPTEGVAHFDHRAEDVVPC